MKNLILIILSIVAFSLKAQNYNPVVNYNYNGTPQHGVKIKTNLPYTNGSQMPTLVIEGYNYGKNETIGLIINWYIYGSNFIRHSVSSFGSYTPEIKLLNENNKVIVFINDRQYFNRFTVRGYAKGMTENDSHFQGWTINDEVTSGSNEVIVPYKNKFAGDIKFPDGIWNKNGNVGIGTINPSVKLAVNGTVHSREVKVDLVDWPDYVFEKDYKLSSLEEVEKHIKEKGHLKNIPTAEEVEKNGLQLGKMNKKLLQKVEELTLYTIKQQKELNIEKQKNTNLEKRLVKLEKLINQKLD